MADATLRVLIGSGAVLAAMSFAPADEVNPPSADSAPVLASLTRIRNTDIATVLNVETDFDAAGGRVRVTVYDSEENFLEQAAAKFESTIGPRRLATVNLDGLETGDYAFVAYYDKNGDGKLNRSALGWPKEPYAFSNGVKPKLRKPKFDEAKVDVAPGAIITLKISD